MTNENPTANIFLGKTEIKTHNPRRRKDLVNMNPLKKIYCSVLMGAQELEQFYYKLMDTPEAASGKPEAS